VKEARSQSQIFNRKSISRNTTHRQSYHLIQIESWAFNYYWKGAWSYHRKSLPIPAVRNTVGRTFSKLKLIKTFRRSIMTDERLTNLTMICIESETAKTLDMTELTKTFASFKT